MLRQIGHSLFFLCAALLLNGCASSGGSGNSQGGGNSGAGVPAAISVSAGNQQNGVPGETLDTPADVKVVDNAGNAVPNATVTFSASAGGQVFAATVSTRFNGHARTLMRLPGTPFTKMTVTASVGALSTTLTETTGPRLTATYGNATATRGRVRPDGNYFGIGRDGDLEPDIGYDWFAPNGTLAGRLGPLQATMGLPGMFDNMWSVLATPDEKLYFRSGIDTSINSAYVVELDSGLNLVEFVDLDSSYEVESALSSFSGPTAVDAAGNLYLAQNSCSGTPACNNEIYIFNPSGTNTGKVPINLTMLGIAVNAAGNIVALVFPPTGPVLAEYSLSGQLVNSPSTPAFSELAQMVQDPAGNYIILDEGTVYTFDQNYLLLNTASLKTYLEATQMVLSGADSAGNIYLSSSVSTDLSKYDQNGNLLSVTALPVQSGCTGCPPPVSINGLVAPFAMASDPVTGDLYALDANLAYGPTINQYVSGQYTSRLAPPSIVFANDIGVSIARNFYVVDLKNTDIQVLDMSGNAVSTLLSSQVGSPVSIALDSSDNKYVLDISNTSVHVLNSSDQTVTTFTLNLPANYGSTVGGLIRVAADGTLVVCFNDDNTYVVKKLGTDGSEVFSQSWKQTDFAVAGVTGDSKGNTFVAGYDQMQVLDPNGNELGQFDIQIYAGSDCGIAQQGDTALVCYANHIYAFTAE
jgi:hypothetical protein